MHTFIKNLLNGQLVEWKTLGEVAIIKTGQSVSKQKILDNQGIYPVINSGKEPLGYIDEWNTENDPIGITSRGAGVGSIIWQEGKYFRGNLNYSTTIKDKEILNARFLYYVLVNFQKTIHSLCTFTGIPALNASELKKLIIPIPPLEIQQKIVQILDAFTAVTAELTAEYNLRVKQYQYYRDLLLDFNHLKNPFANGLNVEWKGLGEVAKKIYSGKNKEKTANGIYSIYGSTGIIGKTNIKAHEGEKILVARVGANAGFVHIAQGEYDVSDNTLVIEEDRSQLILKYLYYVLKGMNLNQFAKGAGQPLITGGYLKSITIPIPPLEIQTQIVEILDKFDTLTHSISEGLPREIELRQKQYEYYRELLLNFQAA
ncbi:restriction endonuclease subunit S [Moraxella ovis]|uniref:restriction endonuclease subunit S n=1 Tax=Moraxella ovis TaxID=29433 RepID=UPI000D871D39|nr:restriction endonuclease subunit S [Moraxella ovis]SPX81047.1 Type I restriction enzyme specificity protein MPN_089 [Moraxella ovis]STZ05975.1 Type I restriction enzyme specificity protein MPN_089 [Moraxella ovis]